MCILFFKMVSLFCQTVTPFPPTHWLVFRIPSPSFHQNSERILQSFNLFLKTVILFVKTLSLCFQVFDLFLKTVTPSIKKLSFNLSGKQT